MAPDSTEGWRGPSRGDFLMLPPMKLNAHIPQRLLHPAADYAVTRRSVKVSERTMAHGVDSDFQGMLRISHASGEQPRAPKNAQQSPDLASRTRPPSPSADTEVIAPSAVQMQSFSTPPASAPRKAQVTTTPKPPSPLGTTQRQVNRTIGRPQDRKPSSRSSDLPSTPAAKVDSTELSDTTVSAIMNDVTNASAAPIADQRVRRRDGQSSVISKSPTKAEQAKAAQPEDAAESKTRTSAAAIEASESPVVAPAVTTASQPPLARNGVPVPPELAPAPVAKDEPVAPAEVPLVTRKRSRDSLADPVAIAAAKKAAAEAEAAEAEAKAASERAREMTPVPARPLGSSASSPANENSSPQSTTIPGQVISSSPTSKPPVVPAGRADISAPRRTAPSVAAVAPTLENPVIEPSHDAPEEVELSSRSAPESEASTRSGAADSRSASAPTAPSTAGVQRRASDTPPVSVPPSQAAVTAPLAAQGSSASAGTTAEANGSTVSSGTTAEANGSTVSSGTTAEANGSTPAAPAPAPSDKVRARAAVDSPEVELAARTTPHVETVGAGSTAAPAITAPAQGSSIPATPAMSSNSSTPATPTRAEAQGSTVAAGITAEAQGSTVVRASSGEANSSTPASALRAEAQGSTPSAAITAPANGSTTASGITAQAQGSTVRTPAPIPTEIVRTHDIADASEVPLTARTTPHVGTVAAGSTPTAGVTAPARGSTVTAGNSASSSSSPSSSSPSSSSPSSAIPVTAGVQRRASGDSVAAPSSPSAESAVESSDPADSASAHSASPVAIRESVRASESADADDVELVSRTTRSESAQSSPATPSASAHVDPVPAARATSQAVPADVRAAVAAVAGSAPQNVNLKRGAHVDAHASAIKADAFTAKETVHVPGTAPLTSDSSRRLLAHELTHVVQQQKHGSRLPAENTPAGRALEAEALRAETLIGMPNARSGAVAGMPPFSSGNSSSPGVVQNARTSTPSPGTSAAAQGSSPGSGILATAQGSSPTPGLVARANGSSVAPANPASAHGSSPAAGAPAIARGSSPTAPAPIELAPRRPASPPVVVSGNDMHTVAYSGGGNPPPPGMPPVQRRASGMPPLGFARDSEMPPPIEPQRTPPVPAAPIQSASASPAPPGIETWRDHRWLERHASALYPLIRGMLRDELLRDRERRGKMMREY